MISRKVKIQLAVFTTLTLIAVSLISFQYVKVPSLMGIGQKTIAAEFTEGGGIYRFANVTYRGVTVGKVTGVTPQPDGTVRVDMRIDDDRDVPADVTAAIKSVSAIGEQYVDLIPVSEEGAELISSGAVIGTDRTSVPVPIAKVLDDVNTLVSDVPQNSLTVFLDEASLAFGDIGQPLSDLVDDAQSLLQEADASYDATSALINNGEDFLDDQLASREAVRAWSASLNTFTTAVAQSDADVRALLDSVPPAAGQVEGLVEDLGRTAPAVIGSGQILADLGVAYNDPIEQLLGMLSILEVDYKRNAYIHNDGPALALRPIVNYDGECGDSWPRSGTELGPRGSSQLADLPYPEDTYCKVPQDDPRVTRGSRNLLCYEPGSPAGRRAATVQQCRGDGYQDRGSNGTIIVPTVVPDPLTSIVDGLLAAADTGTPATVGVPAGEGTGDWRSLLSSTLP